jgi:hypothetical protein
MKVGRASEVIGRAGNAVMGMVGWSLLALLFGSCFAIGGRGDSSVDRGETSGDRGGPGGSGGTSGSGGTGSGSSREWTCLESSSQCRCRAHGEDTLVGGSGRRVPRCAGYDCCLLWEPVGDPEGARCECIEPAGSCEAEAASRRDTQVVPACPPVSEQPPVMCADPGEEIALDAQCRRARIIDRPTIVQPLQTNEGPLSLGNVYISRVAHGPGGCLVSANFDFTGSGCILSVSVGPERDSEGRFIVREEIGCEYLTSPLQGTLTFDGVSCLNSGHCSAGTFDFRLTSPPSTDTEDLHTQWLTGEPFILEGSFCTLGESVASCR